MKIKLENSKEIIPITKVIQKPIRQDRDKYKKIRSLTTTKKEKKEKVSKKKIIQKKNIDLKVILLSSILIFISIVIYQLKFGSCEFWAAYEKNFNKIVYGDQFYCYHKINSSIIVDHLKNQLINQDDAIKLLNKSFDLANLEKFIQISISGDTGVGKSLTTNIIANNFQWHRNIQRYNYEINKLQDLSLKIISRLSSCGFNLIIIDDLVPNTFVIEDVIFLENEIRNFAKREEYKVILIAVFNANVDEKLQEEMTNFVQIQFEPFTHDALIRCIKMHQKFFNNIDLNEEEIEELQEIDFTSSGCKQVSKRLNLISNKYDKV